MSGPLQGKRIYVTGATGGIGRATAEVLRERGARVFLTDRDDAVADVAKAIGAEGSAVADVTDAQAVTTSVQAAADALGGLDGLFLNAGTEGRYAALADLDPADLRHTFDVNVLGVFHGLQAGAPHLAQAGGGSIVITASVASFVGAPRSGPYCISKHAVMGLMRTAAQELGRQGIRVNSVNPGPIDNRMMAALETLVAPGNEAVVRKRFTSRTPLGRYGESAEVGRLVAFLMSDDASYCTGQPFVLDGGMRSG